MRRETEREREEEGGRRERSFAESFARDRKKRERGEDEKDGCGGQEMQLG